MYKAGDETREKVFLTAKTLFYEIGYKSTSCAMIAKEADANVALISYYFKNKLNLALEVYSQLMADIRSIVKDKIIDFGYEYEQIIEISVENRICHHFQLLNENFDKFIRELCNENGLLFSDYVNINTEQLENTYHIKLNRADEKIARFCILSLANGMNVAINNGYIDKNEYSVEKSIDMILKILDFKKTQRDMILKKSLVIFNKMHLSMNKDFSIVN